MQSSSEDYNMSEKDIDLTNNSKTDGVGYTALQQNHRLKEKDAIAKYVVNEIIQDGMSIFLDAGSTVHRVGLRLINNSSIRGLTIITNNMLIFNEFTKRNVEMTKQGNVLALTGGVYNQNHEALFGQAAAQVLKSFYPLVAIIGTSGFMVEDSNDNQQNDQKKGAFHHDIVSEIVSKQAIAATRTTHRIIVCDYSKIGIWDASCFATISEIAEKTDQCTIVTSIVPEDEEDNKRYNKRFRDTHKALLNLNYSNIRMIRVGYDGKPNPL